MLLDNLKKSGVIRSIGVSVGSPEDALIMSDVLKLDSVQANFNMLDIRVIKSGLSVKAVDDNFSIIARTPLASGFLSGDISENIEFSSSDHRSRWSRDEIMKWNKFGNEVRNSCVERDSNSNVSLALRYCLSYSWVASTIVGMTSVDEVKANQGVSDLGPLLNSSLDNIMNLHENNNFRVLSA